MSQIAICFLFFGVLFVYIGFQVWCICNQRTTTSEKKEEQNSLLHV